MPRIATVILGFALLGLPAVTTSAQESVPTASASGQDHAGVAGHIATLLAAPGDSAINLPDGDRTAVRAFYAARNHRPLWVWGNGLNTRARRLLGQLATAAEDGLRPTDYMPRMLVSFADEGTDFAGDNRAMARLELEVTRAALAYARHASGGRVVPSEVDRNMAIVPGPVEPAAALDALAATVRPDRYLAGLLPRHDSYLALKAALAEHRARVAGNPVTPIPDGPLIRPGGSDPRIRMIRQRLIERGDYSLKVTALAATGSDGRPASESALVSPRYEAALVKAVRKFQSEAGLAPDGIIGRATLAALNGRERGGIGTILINMERMRWLPRDLGKRHVLVNQAAFRLRLYDDMEIVHSARVIIGKRRHQTPVFADEIDHIVFNPYWNVPRSIATREMLPRLKRDPTYLARQGYEVYWKDGGKVRRIDSSVVDWAWVDRRSFNFSFRQPPGRANALGRIKFMFPNRYNIYLHDTPSRSLFARASRAFSHGCIRLQHPEKLAKILLGWDKGWAPGKVARKIAGGRNQTVRLDRRIPIYLTYLTAWMGDDGTVEFHDDVYGRDPALLRALGLERLAMK